MNASPTVTNTVDNLEELLTNMFGKPAPPKEEILRHKWLESEKAGHDIGVLAAMYDWGEKHYADWKLAHLGGEMPARTKRLFASVRRANLLTRYALLPLAALWIITSLLKWTIGFDYTDAVTPDQPQWMDGPRTIR